MESNTVKTFKKKGMQIYRMSNVDKSSEDISDEEGIIRKNLIGKMSKKITSDLYKNIKF